MWKGESDFLRRLIDPGRADRGPRAYEAVIGDSRDE